MKKWLSLLIAISLTLSLYACGDNSVTEETEETPKETVEEEVIPMTEQEILQMYSNPKNYTGRYLTLVGKVFTAPEYDEEGVYFQMYADPENYEYNTLVGYPDPNADIRDGDYVYIEGWIADAYEGENMLGVTMVAPIVAAEYLEIVSYKDAVMPTQYIAYADTPTVEQNGYSVTVQGVELASAETRVYVAVTNNGSSEFSLYDYSAKIIQNGKQYEKETNFDADYPEVQDDLSVGVTTEGVITFPAIEAAPFQLILPATSDDWQEDIDDYVFEFSSVS